MGDTTTPLVDLVKPEVGASRSTWGNKWNGNADQIDAWFTSHNNQINTLESQVAALQSQMAAVQGHGVPIGAIFPWPMNVGAPSGYLGCFGGTQLIASYPSLFAVIGNYFGGDGTTTFGIPDYRGCVLAGTDGGTGRLGGLVTPDNPGAVGGAAFVAISEAQMPSHQHAGMTDDQGIHTHGYTTYNLPGGAGFQVGSGAQFLAVGQQTDAAGEHAHNLIIDFRGGGQGHANVQVTMLVWWLIRAV